MDVESNEVVDVPDEGHYAIQVNGERAGLTAYTLSGSTITFTHTETEPELQGQGIATDLIRGALDDVRRRGLDVVPQCSFVRGFIDEHEEYADLLPSP